MAWSQSDYDRARVLATDMLTTAHALGAVFEELSAHRLLGMIALKERILLPPRIISSRAPRSRRHMDTKSTW